MTVAAPPELDGLVYRELVGSGGYADVYLYEQQMPRMRVAVKVLKGEGLTDSIRRQFRDEADTMAQLADHPYIVQVFRSGTSLDGRPYLVMKYYPPPNLALRSRNERLSVEEVLRTGIQLASAVETAHRAGITHRDIKPANVLVSQYGAPGLTDFGIAGQLGHGAAEDDEDDVGVSVPWAPPEVLFGQSNGDARADVYSLSATLWQLLVGRSPFEIPGGDNSAYGLMPRIRTSPVPATGRADVPVSLERLLTQAMAKDPAARPQSAIAFARSLQEIEQEQRFTRTAIVVLDEQGQTTLADQSAPVQGADDDRTRVRAPQSVQGQTPVAPRPRSVGGTVAVNGAQGVAGPASHAAYEHPSVDAVDVGGTVSRDRLATRTVEPEAPAPAPQRNPAVTLAAVAVALVAVVVGASVLFGRGDDDPEDAPKTVASQSADVALSVPSTPTLEAKGVPGGVAFTWQYLAPEKPDRFFLRTAANTGALGESLDGAPLAEATSTVKASKGAQVCAQVKVSREGLASEYSAPVCGRAK
ncbi:serine/threonine-protein kinase [Pedococcus aerophilus]|uniref:non-specific serine/threonine protein kinase n=1 Tax=Pedococcus aerophilus TaxID=436356 RepID=A0ABN3UTG6_9MICO